MNNFSGLIWLLFTAGSCQKRAAAFFAPPSYWLMISLHVIPVGVYYFVRSPPIFMVWILNCSFKFSTSTLEFYSCSRSGRFYFRLRFEACAEQPEPQDFYGRDILFPRATRLNKWRTSFQDHMAKKRRALGTRMRSRFDVPRVFPAVPADQ